MKQNKIDFQNTLDMCKENIQEIIQKGRVFINRSLTRSYDLRTYDCDRYGNIRIVYLMNLLQDVTQRHLSKLRYAEDYLKIQKAWVVSCYHIKIFRYPKVGERINVVTWVSQKDKISLLREFSVVDTNGREIVQAVSKWALIDMSAKKTIAVPAFRVKNLHLFETKFKHVVAKDKPIISSEEIKVKFDNIDFNQHLNNAKYGGWACDSVDKEFRLEMEPCEIIISYKQEAQYDDNLEISVQKTEEGRVAKTLHVFKKGTEECSRISIIWSAKT